MAPGFAMVAAATAAMPTGERGDDGRQGARKARARRRQRQQQRHGNGGGWGVEETVLAVVEGEEKVTLGNYHNMAWQIFTVNGDHNKSVCKDAFPW